MVNIKANKRNNNAVAAITQLVNDYVHANPNSLIHFLVIKFNYEISISRKIKIKSIDSFFIEEMDFLQGHKQDSRNWSKNLNLNSGRLQISNKFRADNLLREDQISNERTKNFLLEIFKKNESESQK